MAEILESSPELESALASAFSPAPKASAPVPAATPPAADPVSEAEAPLTPEEELIALLPSDDPEEVKAEPAADDPEFEIEVNGQKEIIKGRDKVVEMLQKATDYSKKSEENARVRQALIAQANAADLRGKFREASLQDIAELTSLDKQLEAYDKYDWATAIDQDFVQTMKLQEQRNQLRQARAQKAEQLNQKAAQFDQEQSKANAEILRAEQEALLAKLPKWRNSETAQTEKQRIGETLRGYGYQDDELHLLTDHRAMLVARDAMLYRELLKSKDARVKQVRQAPPVNAPGPAGQQEQKGDKASFARFTKGFRAEGQRGNHLAQEKALLNLFGRTFKTKGN